MVVDDHDDCDHDGIYESQTVDSGDSRVKFEFKRYRNEGGP